MNKQLLEEYSCDNYSNFSTPRVKRAIEAALLQDIVQLSDGRLNQEFLDLKNCTELLENDAFRQDFLKCWMEGRFDEIANFAILQCQRDQVTSVPRNVSSCSCSGDHIDQQEATMRSWNVEFQGEAAETLWKHVKGHYAIASKRAGYVPYTAIVQSSGMGKSRVTDELAKKRFVIPICLRPEGSTGFPPSDAAARQFLADSRSPHIRAVAFLSALFGQAAEEVRTIQSDQNNKDPETSTARCFRDRMTDNQSFRGANQYRTDFFASIERRANEMLPRIEDYYKESGSTSLVQRSHPRGLENPLVPAFTDLVNALQAASALSTSSSTQARLASDQAPVVEKDDVNTGQADAPLVILVVDEAQVLSEQKLDVESGSSWSYFDELCQALQVLKKMPLYTLFLSTTPKIAQLVPSPPFTDLGFDTLVSSLSNTFTLGNITRERFMVQFGRPLFASRYQNGAYYVRQSIILFAAAKLLNIRLVGQEELNSLSEPQKLACLSQRLPLEFVPSDSLGVDEMKQVEAHMRVCLKIDSFRRTMQSISPSEPLLSEAAYAIMQAGDFNAPEALLSVMTEFPIHQGYRGEILTLLLLTLARDACVRSNNPGGIDSLLNSFEDNRRRTISITQFIKQLFHYQNLFPESPAEDPTGLARHVAKESETRSTRECFEEDFKDAYLHFNHCIKGLDQGLLDRGYFQDILVRGAALLCPNSQKTVDIVVPFLLEEDVAHEDWKSVLSFILVQINNDAKFGTFEEGYFDDMDPYRLGILQPTDEPVNFIRMFFSLATPTPGLRIKRTKLTSPSKAAYYAYDIWCAGIDPSFLVPVNCADKGTWEALLRLDASTGWQDIYKSGNDWVKERAYQNPSAASGEDFRRWFTCAQDENTDKP